MQLVIPMAGLGQRFRDAGYTVPKPLIPVDGVPMIVRVVRNMRFSRHIVFVVNRDHVRSHAIDDVLTRYFADCKVVVAPGLTDGQASSVALAEPYLNPDEDICIAACDNTHLYSEAALDQMLALGAADSIVWTYTGEPRVLASPASFGWVAADSSHRVTRISVKKPISDNPLRDYVISGTFWFRSAKLLFDGIRDLTALNRRVNNEFYLDSVPQLQLEQQKDVRMLLIDKYVGWGTPDDLIDYMKWSQYFRRTATSDPIDLIDLKPATGNQDRL